MLKLSIIIPAFNVEEYISQCLLSCVKQDLLSSEYEIIVVNDGSEDGTEEIIDDIKRNNTNIVVISQNNKGLSEARNAGLSIAKGDYIWFVDSDDYIADYCLGDIIETLYENQLDGLRVMDAVDEGGSLHDVKSAVLEGVVSGINILTGKNTYRCTAWITIFKRELLINYNFRFYPGLYHEDLEFTPRVYWSMSRMMFYYKRYVYIRRKREGSITSSYSLKRSLDLLVVANNLYHFKLSLSERHIRYVYDRIICNMAINAAALNAEKLDNRNITLFIKELNTQPYLLDCYFSSRNIYLIIEGFFLKLLSKWRWGVFKSFIVIKKYMKIER